MASCNECICSEVCYYKSFNDVRNLKKRRNDVEKFCKSFVHRDSLKNAPTVDAVEVNKYEAVVGMYHDLRENFVDYVCSGIRNEAPYCLNKCEECVDKRGWCKLEKCQGFNPAEVILDRYAKMDGDGNGNL